MNSTTVDFATLPPLPEGFERTVRGYVRTPAGLVIGSALHTKPVEITTDAEKIQAALLGDRRPAADIALDWWDRNMGRALGTLVAFGLVLGMARKVFA